MKAGVWHAMKGTDLAGDRLYFLVRPTLQLTSAVFAPRSQTIATTSFDGTVPTFACVLCGGLERLVPAAHARLRTLGRR
jgi:hypothetical protein